MMKRRMMRGAALLLCLLMCAGGGAALGEDMLYQVSTLNALMLGLYDGVVPVEVFLQHGNTGLGTIDRLDGEMITLDGVVYQIKDDGSVTIVPPDATIPFGVVTAFETDAAQTLTAPIEGIEALAACLDAMEAVAQNPNRMYVVKLTGRFDAIRTRSVPAQDTPYPPLSEVTETQREFTFEAVEGTIVGVYFPAYLSSVNMHGWHLHFLSSDRASGGHLLDAQVASGTIELDAIDRFMLLLPDTDAFAAAALSEDLSEAIESVER